MRTRELTIKLRTLHSRQQAIYKSPAKRKVVRAGRRGGKTTGAAYMALQRFLRGGRVLYAVPTMEQIDRFWFEVTRSLAEPLGARYYYKNETRHVIELPGTEQRIRAKTAWNADTLRGDYADLLILDEYQIMGADTWRKVGAPMLLDNNGDAVFIYTSKRGGHHSKELYKRAAADKSGRWATFHFTSHDNPYLSAEALAEISSDMTAMGYRMEIMAEDIEDDPRALWTRENIRHATEPPDYSRIVVAVDPPGTAEGAECGIVVVALGKDGNGYVLADYSKRGSPATWARRAVMAYVEWAADRMVAEINFGADMVEHTIRSVAGGQAVRFRQVRASRGKAIRAEPVAALYEQSRVYHVGTMGALEDQLCNWVPGEGDSPDRLDALVWGISDLKLTRKGAGRPLVLWGYDDED